jgi:hypothetical protein
MPVIPKRPMRILNVQEAAAMIQKAWRRHIVSLVSDIENSTFPLVIMSRI